MTQSIIKPKRPTGAGWRQIKAPSPPLDNAGYAYELWAHDERGIGALSAVEVAREPGKPDIGLEYHLSVSAFGRRRTTADALWALAQFGLADAKEDHVPGGVARNYVWRGVTR